MKRLVLSLMLLAALTGGAYAFGLSLRIEGKLGASAKKGSGTSQSCTQGLLFNATCNTMYIPIFIH